MAIAFFIFCDFFLQLKRKFCGEIVEKEGTTDIYREMEVTCSLASSAIFKQQTATKSKSFYPHGHGFKLKTILNFEPGTSRIGYNIEYRAFTVKEN
jgi:hypothetical protein